MKKLLILILIAIVGCHSEQKSTCRECEQSYIDSVNKKLDRDVKFIEYKGKLVVEGLKQGKTKKQAEADADSIAGDGSDSSSDARLRADLEKYKKENNK